MRSRLAYFDFPLADFVKYSDREIMGYLAIEHRHELEEKQKNAWLKYYAKEEG